MQTLNHRGFTLIEVMVSVGILGIAITAVIALTQNMVQAAVTAERNQAATDLRYHISRIVNNERYCTAALAGESSVDGEEINLSNIRGGAVIDRLQIHYARLRNPRAVVGDTYSAEVEVRASKLGQVYGSQDVIMKSTVFYRVDDPAAPMPTIERCLTSVVDAGINCRALGGDWDGATCSFCRALGGEFDPVTRRCITTPPTYFWRTSEWSECADGTRTRTAACVDGRTLDSVPADRCMDPMPPLSDTCGGNNYCLPNSRSGTATLWVSGNGPAAIRAITEPTITAEDKEAVIAVIDQALRNPTSTMTCAYVSGANAGPTEEMSYTCNRSYSRGNLNATIYYNYFRYAQGDCTVPVGESYPTGCVIESGPGYTVNWFVCSETRPW